MKYFHKKNYNITSLSLIGRRLTNLIYADVPLCSLLSCRLLWQFDKMLSLNLFGVFHTIMIVFSGHGGARAAEYVKQNLFSNLIRHPKFISDTKSAIGAVLPFFFHSQYKSSDWCYVQHLLNKLVSCIVLTPPKPASAADAYNHTDTEFLKSENSQNRDAGSTASTAILVGDRLLVANVGDSRAVICRGGNGSC